MAVWNFQSMLYIVLFVHYGSDIFYIGNILNKAIDETDQTHTLPLSVDC